MLMFKSDHALWILIMILLAWVMFKVVIPQQLTSQSVLPFQFMHNRVLDPGAFSIAPPAATVRSQKMSCHKCGGRKREYTN